MNMTPANFGRSLKQPYTWLGGYPTYFVTSDGAALCHKCAKANSARIISSIRDGCSDGWKVEAQDINWENPDLFCDHCSQRIESAYAEDEATN